MNGPRWYVATYSDMGIDVEFFSDEAEYAAAREKAMAEHSSGRLDSYINGEVR